MIKKVASNLFIFLICLNFALSQNGFQRPQIDFNPNYYISYKTDDSIKINGKLNEEAWQKTDWSNNFINIKGKTAPSPEYRTKIKLIWDENYLYIGAFLEEPHIWARSQKRDSQVFRDDAFEIFIDPDSDTHNYLELQINAYATITDLFITKPYRDSGVSIGNWQATGIKKGTHIKGTINNGKDIDQGWIVELAYPWSAIAECTHKHIPPEDGMQFRMNFSRVEWPVQYKNGIYTKEKNSTKTEVKSAKYSVWSPQGLVNLHYPEMWGVVQFETKSRPEEKKKESLIKNKSFYEIAYRLYQIYYSQKQYQTKNGRYASQKQLFKHIKKNKYTESIKIYSGRNFFRGVLNLPNINKVFTINNYGKLETIYK